MSINDTYLAIFLGSKIRLKMMTGTPFQKRNGGQRSGKELRKAPGCDRPSASGRRRREFC
jgi:hypothetical protein